MTCATSWPRAENWYSTRCSRGTTFFFRLVSSSMSSSVRETRALYAMRRHEVLSRRERNAPRSTTVPPAVERSAEPEAGDCNVGVTGP